MQLAASIFWGPAEVEDRLYQLDLTQTSLWESVKYGQAFAAECTIHDPSVGKSVIAWTKVTRRLRDFLVPKGWLKENPNNYEMTVHPDRRLGIVASAGDSNTGIQDRTPMTRVQKGVMTKRIINDNQPSFSDVSFDPKWRKPTEKRKTWILLFHIYGRNSDKVRAELSLPVATNLDGRVSVWEERIILSDPDDRFQIETSHPEFDPTVDDLIDVPVKPKEKLA